MVTLKSIVAANKRLYARFTDGTELEFNSLDDLKRWSSDVPDDIERKLACRDAVALADEKTITAVKDLKMDIATVRPTSVVAVR